MSKARRRAGPRVAELSDRLLATSTYLAREFTTIGGNTASASMSVFIENNCTARGGYPACPNGSDRITMFAAVPRTPACRVSHVDNNVSPPRFAFWFRDESGEPRCCLNDELNGERTPGSKTQYLKRHLMLSQGPFHKPVLLIAEHLAPGFTTVPAPAVYTSTDLDGDGDVDSRCTFRAIEVVPSVQRTEPPLVTDWVDASASIVDMRTIFIDSREAPMNFDVAQFIAAMLDGAKGELGNSFCGVRDPSDTAPCRRFNGIVYITATWPGSLKGLATAGEQPERAPFQGSEVGVSGVPLQPPGTFQNRRRWLPRQLCGAKGLENLVTPTPLEGTGTGGTSFPIIGCDPTATSPYQKVYIDGAGPRTSVNAVRIINGRDLTPLLTPASSKVRLGNLGGLTIVSSLPVYIYGDYNAVVGPVTDPAQVCPTSGTLPAGCGFPLTMIGGDRTTFVSRVGLCNSSAPGYNDSCARWGDSASPGIAAQTFYTGAFMSALSPTVPQENVETLFRVIQHWGSTSGGKPTLNVTGAMFATGRAYYQAEPQRGSLHPQLEWKYQSALSALEQPPGSPRFVVGVTSRWRDLR